MRTSAAIERMATWRNWFASLARQVMLTTPHTRRVTGWNTGAATQASSWKARTKCAAPSTVATFLLSSAVPTPLVPICSSLKTKRCSR